MPTETKSPSSFGFFLMMKSGETRLLLPNNAVSEPTASGKPAPTTSPRQGGSAIFDRQTVEQLLREYQVAYAVFDADIDVEAEVNATDSELRNGAQVGRDWRDDARRRMEIAADAAEGDVPLEESFAFFAQLERERLDGVLTRATRLLRDDAASEEAWEQFLDAEARRTASRFADVEVRRPEAGDEDAEDSRRPLFDLPDLGLTFAQGALRAPAPLANAAD